MRGARPPAEDVVIDADTGLAAAGDDPERAHERSARQRLVQRALARLARRNREILVLQELEGLELRAVAERLGIPLGTAKSRAHRARHELARLVLELDPSLGSQARP
jgi:RNA polymerase sigma-70 factor (ECF subfamily)